MSRGSPSDFAVLDWRPPPVWHQNVVQLFVSYVSLWEHYPFPDRGRLIITPAQNHQIVEKTRFFDVISANMIPYGFLLVFGTVPIRNRAVNDERNHRVSYLPKYRQKRWIFNEFRLKIDFIVLGSTPNHKFWDSDQNSIIIDGKHRKTISTIIFQILDSFFVLKIDFFTCFCGFWSFLIILDRFSWPQVLR